MSNGGVHSPEVVEPQSSRNILRLGFIMAIFFPIAGLLIGVTQLHRNPDKALAMIALSLGMMVLSYVVLNR